jgi:ubiquinone/menaquinone biosynthesis C-methylase UbiE
MNNKTRGDNAYTVEIASSYEDDRKAEIIWNVEQSYMKNLVDNMSHNCSLLDIPIGTGRFLEFYTEKKLNIFGIDISEAMLAEARNKTSSDDVNLEIGDVNSLRFCDRTFDYIICWRLLHLFPNESLKNIITELSRVASDTLYIQAYVKDRSNLSVRLKAVIYRLFFGTSIAVNKPWSHIQSYAHEEKFLLQVFSECNLFLQRIDFLGESSSLKIKVYVLKRI